MTIHVVYVVNSYLVISIGCNWDLLWFKINSVVVTGTMVQDQSQHLNVSFTEVFLIPGKHSIQSDLVYPNSLVLIKTMFGL